MVTVMRDGDGDGEGEGEGGARKSMMTHKCINRSILTPTRSLEARSAQTHHRDETHVGE